MAIIGSLTVPRCTECMRSFAFGYLKEAKAALGGLEHVRGKKKSTRGPLTLPVRLLQDITGFGRKGRIVPVTSGRMKKWFTLRKADYLLESERRELKRTNTVIVRDYEFSEPLPQVPEASIEAQPAPQQRERRFELGGIRPEGAAALIQKFVPDVLEFHRQAIEADTKPAAAPVRTQAVHGAAGDLMALRAKQAEEAARAIEQKIEGRAIYGSVSTTDVLAAVKAVMSVDKEAARLVLDETNISFASAAQLEDATKLKKTGTFKYMIQIRGADAVTRNVRVVARHLSRS